MNINELFETFQDEFTSDELNGEFLLHGKVIIWSYNLTENSEEIAYLDDDEESFSFEASSSEELLQEVYQEDLEKIQLFLDTIEQTDNWRFSDSDVIDDMIVFKIY